MKKASLYQGPNNSWEMGPGFFARLSNRDGEKYEWSSEGTAQKRQLRSWDEEVSFKGTNKVTN